MGGGRNKAAQTTPFKEIALKIIVAPLHEYSSIKYLVSGGHTNVPKINIIVIHSKTEERLCINSIFYKDSWDFPKWIRTFSEFSELGESDKSLEFSQFVQSWQKWYYSHQMI